MLYLRSSPTPLLSLRSIYIISCASFVFHQIHGNLPKSLQETPLFISDSAPYSLRSSNNMYIPPTPAIWSDFNYLIAYQHVWNSLTSSVERCRSFGTFKRILKDHLVKNHIEYFFSPEELISPEFWWWCMVVPSALWIPGLRYVLFFILCVIWLLFSFLVVAYIVFFVSPLYHWPCSLSRGNKCIVFPFCIVLNKIVLFFFFFFYKTFHKFFSAFDRRKIFHESKECYTLHLRSQNLDIYSTSFLWLSAFDRWNLINLIYLKPA